MRTAEEVIEGIREGGLWLVGLWDGYEGKRDMVEQGPRVSFIVEGRKQADELLQFMKAWTETRGADYGDAFVAKTWLPPLVTPSVKVLAEARTELEKWLESVQ